MGTNYYVVGPPCRECGHSDPPMHIGKGGASLRGYFHDSGTPRLTTWREWRSYLLALPPTHYVQDEYGDGYIPAGFVSMVEEWSPETRRRQWDWEVEHAHERHHSRPALGEIVPEGSWLDPDGYSFYGAEFS